MVSRGVLAFAALAMLTGPAAAGGFRCEPGCTRQITLPPIYGTLTEPVLLGTSYKAEIVLPEYRTVAETVQVAPARREWRVTRDAWGRKATGWVSVPPAFALRHRVVMVRPPSVVPAPNEPIFGTRYRSVQLAPARRA